jgi:MoaA/NifB/PqqE/SkfB family radical SAM enzyme
MRLISHPVLCNYYLTYRCNASCHFCDIWEKPSPYVEFDNVHQNLHDLKKIGVRIVDFTGGEPLLHQKLPEILKVARSLGLITTVTTNGLLYPKYAGRLRGLVNMLHFSLDYYDEEKHDRNRGVKCHFKVMESISVALELGERPDILMTVFDDNIADIQKIYENICIPNDLVLILNPVFEYEGVGSSLSEENLEELESWAHMPNVYLNRAFIALRRNGGNHTENPVCRAGSSTIVISPFNNLVLPCYHLGRDEIPIENKLFEIYNSESVRKLIAMEGRLPGCEGCAINCYMQPSFAVEFNRYWLMALPSTLKYNFMKGTWRNLVSRR